MYFHEQFKQEQQQAQGFSSKKEVALKMGQSHSYQKFLRNFGKYRYLYLLVFSILLLFLVIIYAKMIFNIRHNISQLITLQRSTYSRDISNVQVDLQEPREAKAIISQEQVLLAQKWKGISQEDVQIFSDLANEELEYYQEKYNIIDYEEEPFCIITYNFEDHPDRAANLRSLLMQNYDNYHLVYIDKATEEESGDLDAIQAMIMEQNQKKNVKLSRKKTRIEKIYNIIIHTDQEIGDIENLYTIAEGHCKINELILFVDSSHSFIGKEVLKLFNAAYKERKYELAYTNFLNQDNEIGNLTFLTKKKVNRTLILSTRAEAPLFAVPATVLSSVLELQTEDRLLDDNADERLRLHLLLPILEYIKGNAIYIPQVNYVIAQSKSGGSG